MAKRNERCSCGAYTCFCSHNNSAEDAYYANDELDTVPLLTTYEDPRDFADSLDEAALEAEEHGDNFQTTRLRTAAHTIRRLLDACGGFATFVEHSKDEWECKGSTNVKRMRPPSEPLCEVLSEAEEGMCGPVKLQ